MSRLLMGAGVVLLSVLLVGAFWLHRWWHSPLAIPDDGLLIQVAPGDTLGKLSDRLAQRGVLSHRQLLNAFGRFSGADQRIRQGEYRVPAGANIPQLLSLLQSDETVRYLVTLPEGIRLGEALDLLQQTEGLTALLSGSEDERLAALIDGYPSTEGFFLPETYQYERGATDLQMLTEAHRLMEEALERAWSLRDPGLPYENPYELLIMASIIEKETGVAAERPMIGGVFTRRLKQGMRLQTDPTVIYGLGETFDGDLRRQHLLDESNLYNSYRHDGLPPGPIALPGREALMAAAQPATGDSLYFVARGDGSHEFSATLADHEAAVRRFQLNRRSDYRSSPEASP